MQIRKDIGKLIKAYREEALTAADISLASNDANLDFFVISLRLLRDKMALLNDAKDKLAAKSLLTLTAAISAYDKYAACVENHFELTEAGLSPKGGKSKDDAMMAFNDERNKYFGAFCDLMKKNMLFWRVYENDNV